MTVGFLHSITESKNSPMAIEACRLLRARFPDLRVVAFGGNAPKAAEKFPAWIDLSIRPSVEEIATIYGACDAWIFSSDEEGFGLPILEAMAAGTPVVATPAGAAPQLVNKENGALVGRDAQELADAVARILLLQPDEWKKMSRAAEETARRRSWDDAADEFEVVLYDIVNRRGEFIKN
jgi:glycosyltransferase involved in cell wall biosynthesis